MQAAADERGPGDGDVEGVACERRLEGLALQLDAPLVERLLEALANAVQQHPGVAVTDAAERLRRARPVERSQGDVGHHGDGEVIHDRIVCQGRGNPLPRCRGHHQAHLVRSDADAQIARYVTLVVEQKRMAASPDRGALDAAGGQPVQKTDSVRTGAAQNRDRARADPCDALSRRGQVLKRAHHALARGPASNTSKRPTAAS